MTDAQYARLRFLFWRHLDAQQRTDALAEATGMRAKVPPAPQTMEGGLLDLARKNGSIHYVVEHLPERFRRELREEGVQS